MKYSIYCFYRDHFQLPDVPFTSSKEALEIMQDYQLDDNSTEILEILYRYRTDICPSRK